MKRTCFNLMSAFMGLAAILCSSFSALAQTAPPLGVLQQFSALGNSGVTGSTGAGTVVNGDVGSSPTASITNFPPSSVTPPFTLHPTNDLTVQQAHTDAIAAYNFLAAQGPGTVLPAQLNGAVLTSGIYSFAGGAADLAALGTLTLNGPGIFIFQVNSALTANVGSNVIGTASPCNVFWRVGTSATLNGSGFLGNVIADANITVGSGSNVTGRAIAGTGPTGAVTMAGAGGNTIGGCASQGIIGVGNPTESSAVDSGTVSLPIGVSLPIAAGLTTVGLTGVLEVEDGTNLDLFLLDPLGNVLKASETTRPTEVVRWTPAAPGLYTFLVVNKGLADCPYTAYTVTTESTSGTASSGTINRLGSMSNTQTIDCDDPGISRKGGWHEVRDDRATGGHYCRNVGAGKGDAFLEFTFTGAGLDMQLARGPRGGIAELFMDGVSRGLITFYRPPSDPAHPDNSGKRDLTFGDFVRLTTASPGTHVFRLEVANDLSPASLRDMIYVDGFVIYLTQTPTAVEDGSDPGFRVAVHYNNPPRGPVELAMTTSEPGRLKVELFDLNGRRVRTVLDEPFAPAGTRSLPLDGLGGDGRALDSSVYFYRVQSRERSASGSVLFLK